MRGSTKHVTVALATTVTCIVLFCVPMVLRYEVYKESAFSLTAGDLVPITQRISSVWCAAQTLRTQGNSTFESFFLPEEPKVLGFVKDVETFASFSELKVAGIEYWGFYLPAGSRINISTCARLPGATLTVVRGQKSLTDCIQVFHTHNQNDQSEESEESEEEEGPSSSESSSEGVFTKEAVEEGAFHCPHLSVEHKALQHEVSCSRDLIEKGRNLRYQDSVSLESKETDYHYVIFSTGGILDRFKNEIFWSIDLLRTTFDLQSSQMNCSSDQEEGRECRLPLNFASSHTCLVKMSHSTNGTDHAPVTDTLLSNCEPRKGLYFVFFLLIFLAIGFCAFH